MTDLHLDHFLYLLHSCTHYYQSRGLPLAQGQWRYFYKTIRRRACYQTVRRLFYYKTVRGTRARYQTIRRFFFISEFDGICTYFWTTRLYGAHYQTARRAGFEFWRFCAFCDYQSARGQRTWWWLLFPCRKSILFNNIIIMYLLHSCIQCDLDYSRSILHKSRDGYDHSFFRLPDCSGHITKQHGDGFEFGDFCPFFDYQTARGKPSW